MRRRALNILRAVDAGRGFADQHLTSDDPPFVRELVLGVLRRRLTLDSVLAAYSKRALDTLDDDVLGALRLGLYQILFLDGVPPHAAVSETVSSIGRASAKSFVNGLLRTVLRECNKVTPDKDRGGASPRKRLEREGRNVTFFTRRVFPDPEQDRMGWLAAVHSHPVELVTRWVEQLGEEKSVERMVAGNRVPLLTLRPRAGRADADAVVAALAKQGVQSQVIAREQGPDAVAVVPGSKKVLSGKAFRSGMFAVQDVAQFDAAEQLAPRAGETIWDACAAPGGKTCHLAELADGEAHIVATDRNASRLKNLGPQLERLGLEGVTIGEHDALSDEPPTGMPDQGFDAILLDAPCTNTAVLDRRPEARWRFDGESLSELVALQERMLTSVRRHLRPGGRLVYSVCSHEPEEQSHAGLARSLSPFVSLSTAAE